MDASVSFGYWVRRKRKALDLTQEDLANCVGCALVTLRKFESDERRPSPQMAERLAVCLELSQQERSLFLSVARGERPPARLTLPTSPTHYGKKSKFPVPLTPLIGRSTELEAILACLRRKEVRLHTFTGPQGIGKTRLAMEAGFHLREDFRDGVFPIDLTRIEDPATIPQITVEKLGFRKPGAIVTDETVIEILQDQEVLLIYDRFDHLRPAVDFLMRLLQHAPDVHLIVTCCSPLNIYGEYEYVVPALSLPAGKSLAEDLESDSAQLFCERLRAVRNEFRLTDDQAPVVIEICSRLGGFPSAIEHAAARFRQISLDDLLSELNRRKSGTAEEVIGSLFDVHLLGSFQLFFSNQPVSIGPSSRLKSLLAYLILHPGIPISRQQLASLFWPETTEPQARTNLRNLLHQLRQSMPFWDTHIQIDEVSLTWRQDSRYSLDVENFQRCLEVKPGQTVRKEMLQRAVQVYTGDLLPDCYEDWICAIREQLRLAYLSALEALAAMAEQERDYPTALDTIRRLVTIDPLHPSANLQLIRLHALLGNRPAAIKAYQVYAQQLRRELGSEPDPEMQEFVRRLKQAQPKIILSKEQVKLIGRKTEWNVIISTWKSVLSGRAQMLLIRGEAGIGKTRLIEELAEWAGSQGIQTAIASCYPAEGSLPYAPIVSWLRSHPFPKLDKIWAVEIARLLPETQSYYPKVKFEPLREGWQRQRLFEALAHVFQSMDQPLLLILEDIHWCDQDTLEWLHFLIRAAPQTPLMIVATARSEEISDEYPLQRLRNALQLESKLIEIQLQPLNVAETIDLSSAMHQQVFGTSLSIAKAKQITLEAEGNPLFAIEMIRLGQAQPCPEPPCVDWLVVSGKIQAVLTGRIAQVSARTREIACLASTIGREFTLEVLQQASKGQDEELILAINELLQKMIIREIAVDTYDFTHDLLRQAAFHGMSSAYQRLLHRKVAEALQQLAPWTDTHRDAEIAGHYEKAGMALLAIQHYRQAAETAAGVFANADALRHLKRAMVLAEGSGIGGTSGISSEEYANLLERLGDMLVLDGKYQQAQTCFDQALSQEFAAPTIWRAQVYRKMNDALVPLSKYDLAHAALDQAEQTLATSRSDLDQSFREEWLQVQLARIQLYYWQGQPDMMEKIIQQVEQETQDSGRLDQQISLYSLKSMARMRRERYRLSAVTMQIVRQRLELTQQTDNPYQLAIAQFQYGFGLLWHGDVPNAREWLQKGLEATRRTGDRIWYVRSLAYLSIADRKLGNLDQVEKETQDLIELCKEIGDYTYLGIGLANQGWLAWKSGNRSRAIQLCMEAHEAWNKGRSGVFHNLANWIMLAVVMEHGNSTELKHPLDLLLDPNPIHQPPPPQTIPILVQTLKAIQVHDEKTALLCVKEAIRIAQEASEL